MFREAGPFVKFQPTSLVYTSNTTLRDACTFHALYVGLPHPYVWVPTTAPQASLSRPVPRSAFRHKFSSPSGRDSTRNQLKHIFAGTGHSLCLRFEVCQALCCRGASAVARPTIAVKRARLSNCRDLRLVELVRSTRSESDLATPALRASPLCAVIFVSTQVNSHERSQTRSRPSRGFEAYGAKCQGDSAFRAELLRQLS